MVNSEPLWSAAACCRFSGVEIGFTWGVATPSARQEVGLSTFNFQLSTFNFDLLGFPRPDTVKRQNVLYRHDTLELMHVGAAYHRQ